MRGTFKQSDDIDPITKNKVDFDCIYTPDEKRRIKPTKACYAMYAINNKDANFVTEVLNGDHGRILESVTFTAYSFCDAVLYQISHDQARYKAIDLLHQMAYYMVKNPDKMINIVEPFLGNHSYESYVKNMYHGTKHLDVEVCTAVLALMWNMKINVVYPSKGSIPFYHPDCVPDVVIVFNEMKHPESHFTATKPDNDKWRPIKGKDWSKEIRVFTNVKNAHAAAEKKLRERLVSKVVTEYNEITLSTNAMKEKLNLYWDQMKSMEEKIKTWSQNVSKMEGKQGVLRMRLLELGVDVASLQKAGPAIQGIHFTSSAPPVTTLTTLTTTPSATVTQSDLGVPVKTTDTSTTVSADVHPTPPPGLTTSQTVSSDPAGQPGISVGLVPQPQTSTTSTVSTAAIGQIMPMSAVQLSQLITPGGTAVGTPQQIISVGGQNILISGSGPGSVGSSSIRYGKILKGVHKYFCSRCQHPFTQKESCVRHENENCPKLPKELKKKYKCDQCGLGNFSSKQYLHEHIHEVHLKTPLYSCKGCGKGYYRHCNMVHHKKSCLAVLVPGLVAPVGEPTTAEDEDPEDLVVNTTAQDTQSTPTPAVSTTAVSSSTTTTSTTADTSERREGDPLIGGGEQGEFSFADPMFLPDLADD